MVTIKIKKLHKDAIIPTIGTTGAAAFDLYAPCDIKIPTGRSVIPLGWAMELPNNYCMEIHARSGFSSRGIQGKAITAVWSCFTKHLFDADIKYGLIDSDYRGEIGAIIVNRDKPFIVKAGTRIAQAVIRRVTTTQFKVVEELTETARGAGGFGHTGV